MSLGALQASRARAVFWVKASHMATRNQMHRGSFDSWCTVPASGDVCLLTSGTEYRAAGDVGHVREPARYGRTKPCGQRICNGYSRQACSVTNCSVNSSRFLG